MTTAFPQQFGRYFLVDKIASGGMAEIFQAKLIGVEGFEKTVVIKRIHPFWSERRDFIAMLVDEAKLLVHLNHPNIVQVYELGREGETYFIAMEFVEGVDLRRLQNRLKAQGRALPPEIACAIVVESLKGLHYAHDRCLKDRGRLDIVHRDVSPQNILLSFEGEVKVTDFGIAKAMTQTHETQTGVLKGKYAYMSPEQAIGAALDARSDLFSTGIVLYELLFERRLFAGKNDLETLENVRLAQVSWPEEAKHLFPGLQQVLSRALQLRPQDRFATGEDFAEALETCIPSGSRVGRRKLAAFLEEVFAEEIQERRRHGEEIRHKTESFLRQTQAGPVPDEATVSLVESPTEHDDAVSSSRDLPSVSVEPPPPLIPDARRRFSRPLVFLLLPFLLGSAYGIWRVFQKAPELGASVSGEIHLVATPEAKVALPAVPETQPLAAQPNTEEAKTTGGPLVLKATPSGAEIMAKYPGGERGGTGELRLEGLPVGTPVQVRATLANYEPFSRSFEVSKDLSPQERVIILEKKAPAYGTLRVNAVPWGRVTVPGLIGGSETPVMRGKVPEGKYSVSVSNSALNKTLRATASVRGGKTTQCQANFEGRAALNCR